MTVDWWIRSKRETKLLRLYTKCNRGSQGQQVLTWDKLHANNKGIEMRELKSEKMIKKHLNRVFDHQVLKNNFICENPLGLFCVPKISLHLLLDVLKTFSVVKMLLLSYIIIRVKISNKSFFFNNREYSNSNGYILMFQKISGSFVL